ncbi:unnamed protein product [Heterobilharzia americana]|nr:unnamed protein product [Heterobilharzia americana]
MHFNCINLLGRNIRTIFMLDTKNNSIVKESTYTSQTAKCLNHTICNSSHGVILRNNFVTLEKQAKSLVVAHLQNSLQLNFMKEKPES